MENEEPLRLITMDYLPFTDLLKEKSVEIQEAYLREISKLQWSPIVVIYVENPPMWLFETPWTNGQILEWLEENDFNGRWHFKRSYVIEFEDREDAVLFKMVWG